MRKNVTIALDAEVARWIRIAAAERDTSVSQYLAELIERERDHEIAYKQTMERFMAREPRPLGPSGHSLPSRDDVHAR